MIINSEHFLAQYPGT